MNEGRQQLELEGKSVSKDPCLQRVGLRVEHWDMSGYTAAIGIAKLLGQDEIVAMLTEDLSEEGPAESWPLPAVKAYAEMVDEDGMDVATVLRLRKKRVAVS